MSWLSRHLIAVAIVALAAASVGAVFAFARPTYHPVTDKKVEMQGQRHYSLVEVRRAFKAQGIVFGHAWHSGSAQRGLTVLGDVRPGTRDDAFTVTLFGPDSTVWFGPAATQSYQAHLGNLVVFYGSTNQAFLAKVKAAVADLKQ